MNEESQHDLMSPAERRQEVARLLARAFVRKRMRMSQAFPAPISPPEKQLDFRREQSVHRVEL